MTVKLVVFYFSEENLKKISSFSQRFFILPRLIIKKAGLYKYMQPSEAFKIFIKERSPEAFSKVIDAHIEMLRKVVYRIVLNEHDADDIVQETFITAYNCIESFKGKAKFSTWLCRIAHNRAYSFLRKKRNITNSLAEEIIVENNYKNSPGRTMHREEVYKGVSDAVRELPYKLRSAITLVAIDEMNIGEAAYVLNCPRATVYWRLHKARKILKEKLKGFLE